MARSLRILVLGTVLATLTAAWPPASSPAFGASLDKKGKADAREALRFYKEGNYEDAARLFLRLSIAYPDMLVFVRNLGACYYYMHRYEPALSNLRDYLHRKTDIPADDRAEVAGWIGEMERLRDQAMTAATPVPAPPAATSPPAAVSAPPVPTPLVPTPAPVAGSGPGAAPASSAAPSDAPGPVAQAVPAASPTPTSPPSPESPSAPTAPLAVAPPVAAPSGADPQATFPQQPPPQGQYPSEPTFPAQGAYPPQPAYPPPDPYPAQTGYPAPGAYPPPEQYPSPAGPGYAPGYATQPGYAPPAGVSTQAPPPPAPQGRSAGRKVAAWLLGLAGVGTAGAGGYFTYQAHAKAKDLEKKYDPSVEDKRKKAVVVSGVCYGIGGALVLTAIIVGATGGSSGSVALAPAVGPGVAGATLSGSF